MASRQSPMKVKQQMARLREFKKSIRVEKPYEYKEVTPSRGARILNELRRRASMTPAQRAAREDIMPFADIRA